MTRSKEYALTGPDGTQALGRSIGARCRGGERITLVGELGAGKTTFTRGLAQGLGVSSDSVSSPTFTILHEHEGGRDGMRLVHADLYRVDEPGELEALGWDELLAMPQAVVAVEWADRVSGSVPDPHLVVRLGHAGSLEERHVVLEFGPAGSHLVLETARDCPICGGKVDERLDTHPFCSARCRMADLGKWFDGGYSVSREIEEDDLMDPDLA